MSEYVKPSELTDAEREVCRAFGAGERLTLPLRGKTDRQVRAAVLVALLTDLYRVKITGVPALRLAGARVTGTLNLESVKISYLIELADCVFINPIDVRMAQLAGLRLPGSRTPGLKGKNLRVDSDLVLEAGFVSNGCLDLTDGTVQGTLRLAGAVLRSPGDHALLGARLNISGSLQATAMRAEGEVRLRGANIGSTLDCTGAHLTKPRLRPDGSLKPSLDARVAMVGKDLLCTHGFLASGGVRVRLVEVHKMASFSGSVLGSAQSRIELNAYGLSAQQLVVRFAEPPAGRVILTRATTISVTDGEFLWAATGGVDLEDFRFEAITAQPEVSVRTRVKWLKRVIPDFAPGPYDLFATFYRRSGHEERAMRVLLEKQRRRHWELGIAGRLWGLLQECTVGYGYRRGWR